MLLLVFIDDFTSGSAALCLGAFSIEVSPGMLSFGNYSGTILLISCAISINVLVYVLPYVKPGMFDLEFERIISISTAVCRRYVSSVMFGKGICCGKYSTVSASRMPLVSGTKHLKHR